MKDEDRKLWADKINDYKSSGLTAAKWTEDRGVAVHKLRYYINKFNREKKQNSNQEFKEIITGTRGHNSCPLVPKKYV